MKNHSLLIFLLIAVTFNLNAQKLGKKDIPTPVLTKFNVFYPTIKTLDWTKEGKIFTAQFKDVDSKKICVLFNADGSLIQREWSASKSDLPDEVIETIQKRFKEYTFLKVNKIEKGGAPFYRVEMSKKESGVKIIYYTVFTDYGGVISSEVKK